MTDLGLFALTNVSGRRILRLPLSQEVQLEITDTFKHQEAEFRAKTRDEVVFDGKYKPDHGESLMILDYNDIDDLHGAVANPLSFPEISPDPTEFSTIKALFSGYKDDVGVNIALIQNFDRRKIISNTGLSLFHSANVYRKVDGVGVTLDTSLTAILEGSKLNFISFFAVRQIFDLNAYYNEATDADIHAFSALPGIQVPDQTNFINMADSWVRRKVSSISQSQILQTKPAEAIANAAANFGIVVKIANVGGQTVILLPENKTDLKKLLRFLDEDYYQSTLLSENYLTNSKRRV